MKHFYTFPFLLEEGSQEPFSNFFKKFFKKLLTNPIKYAIINIEIKKGVLKMFKIENADALAQRTGFQRNAYSRSRQERIKNMIEGYESTILMHLEEDGFYYLTFSAYDGPVGTTPREGAEVSGQIVADFIAAGYDTNLITRICESPTGLLGYQYQIYVSVYH